ncbi:MAG: bifunctional folylpolyglutamate synthase/dihydrofolate synthase, partial [Cyanobacteria bacterium REEB459]|nr:bifunctional folylpolyglutamate synthase/dihydrofolate synthase [Cyanobacteria bacterium REEB459]
THWLMGMLATKDHADIFRALLRPGDYLYLVPVPGHQSADPVTLAAIALNGCPQLRHCQGYKDLAAGLAAMSEGPETLRILCGSLYLIGDFLTSYQVIPLPALKLR